MVIIFVVNIKSVELTHINVSFAHVKSDGTLNTDKVPENKLRQIRTKAKEHGVKVLISLNKNSNGEFAAAIDNAETRSALVSLSGDRGRYLLPLIIDN